jgi:hypothetical protein
VDALVTRALAYPPAKLASFPWIKSHTASNKTCKTRGKSLGLPRRPSFALFVSSRHELKKYWLPILRQTERKPRKSKYGYALLAEFTFLPPGNSLLNRACGHFAVLLIAGEPKSEKL